MGLQQITNVTEAKRKADNESENETNNKDNN